MEQLTLLHDRKQMRRMQAYQPAESAATADADTDEMTTEVLMAMVEALFQPLHASTVGEATWQVCWWRARERECVCVV